MKLNENLLVIMSRGELKGLLRQEAKFVDKAKALLKQALMRKAGKKKQSLMRGKRLRITDHQRFSLLRIGIDFMDTSTTHGKILECWAKMTGATANVEELLTELKFKDIELGVDNPLAWIRATLKQAVLRGDAVEVTTGTPAPIPPNPAVVTGVSEQSDILHS